jgi:hypothetical protein
MDGYQTMQVIRANPELGRSAGAGEILFSMSRERI